jgi:cytochrome c peroxidase
MSMMCSKQFAIIVSVGLLFIVFSFLQIQPQPYQLQYDAKKLSEPEIPTANPLTNEGVALGRLLFYDKILSGNNTQSCGSCHIQQYAFTDGKTKAIGAKGDTVDNNTMSLVNLAWGKKFFWDGRVNSLEELVKHPITHPKEMMQDEKELISELKKHPHYPALFAETFPDESIGMGTISKAIAQFLRTIISNGAALPDSLNITAYTTIGGVDSMAYQKMLRENSFMGMYLRLGIMCTPCHTTESFGGELMANNLLDKNQQQLFKVPSVINSLLTAPYMHDGRFATAEEVITHYDKNISRLHLANRHIKLQPIPNLLTDFDKKNFSAFLALFTDSSVLKNKNFSNPFEEKSFSWGK